MLQTILRAFLIDHVCFLDVSTCNHEPLGLCNINEKDTFYLDPVAFCDIPALLF